MSPGKSVTNRGEHTLAPDSGFTATRQKYALGWPIISQRVFGFDWIFNTHGCDVWELGICQSDCWEMFLLYLLDERSLSASFPRGRAFRYIAHKFDSQNKVYFTKLTLQDTSKNIKNILDSVIPIYYNILQYNFKFYFIIEKCYII